MARYVFMTTGWIIAFQAPVFFLSAVYDLRVHLFTKKKK